jgi:hypothetical protein
MRELTVLSFPFQLVFPADSDFAEYLGVAPVDLRVLDEVHCLFPPNRSFLVPSKVSPAPVRSRSSSRLSPSVLGARRVPGTWTQCYKTF